MVNSAYPSSVAEASSPAALVTRCPYRYINSIYCSASTVRAAISQRQLAAYCSTDNFDCCPVFLGKVLRGNRIMSLP